MTLAWRCARNCIFIIVSSFDLLPLWLGGYLRIIITSPLLALVRVNLRDALRHLALLGHLGLH